MGHDNGPRYIVVFFWMALSVIQLQSNEGFTSTTNAPVLSNHGRDQLTTELHVVAVEDTGRIDIQIIYL